MSASQQVSCPEWSWAPQKVGRCFKNYTVTTIEETLSVLLSVCIWPGTELSTKPWVVWDIGGGLQAGRCCSINSSPAWSSQGQSSRHRLCQRVINTNNPRHFTLQFIHSTALSTLGFYPTFVQGKVEKSRNVSWDCNLSCLWVARTFRLWCSARVPAKVINVYIHTTTHTSLLTYRNPPLYI